MNAQLSPAEGINPTMFVTKRNGTLEPVLLEKIVKAIERHAHGLNHVEPMRIAQKTIAGLYDNAPTSEIDKISIRTAAAMTSEEPQYSLLAGRLQSEFIRKELKGQGIATFSDSIEALHKAGLLNERTYQTVQTHGGVLDAAIRDDRTGQLEYFGIKTVYDRYLLKEPVSRKVLESIQHFMMRVAVGLYPDDVDQALELYNTYSNMDYFSSSPTLFNAGTKHQQLSSCYLLDSPEDSLEAIYDKYADVAKLSKFAGGIGVSFSRVRSRGSYIRGTNGHSNGLVPWLKTLDASVAAVNQGGKRKGAACVYLETWHADVLEFLELRNNTGDHERRTHNLNLANWIPDEFMRRVESDGLWSLMDPSQVPHLVDLHGEAFDRAYVQAEADGLVVNTVKARDLYTAMLKTLAETGNGWMTFKDRANGSSNQTLRPENVIHLSNLCVAPETMVLTDKGEFAIIALADQEVNVWNGEEFSKVTPRRTGENQKLLNVQLSDGRSLDATEYHKWYVQDAYHSDPREVRTVDLQVGQKLIKYTAPVIEGSESLSKAYLNGFYTGDGTALNGPSDRIYLYGEKMELASHFPELKWRSGSLGRLEANVYGLKPKFFEIGRASCRERV